jgi:hypothetical protein
VKKIIDENDKLYTNNKQLWGNYIGNEKNASCGGRSKQPPAKMNFVLADVLRNRQH